MRIETVADFLATVHEGEDVYVINSYLAKPTHVSRVGVDEIEVSHVRDTWGLDPVVRIRGDGHWRYLSDDLNRWHGMFTELQEAIDYMTERKTAYEVDPALIAEHEQAAADSKYFRRLLSDSTAF